jgi:hypothetical protein
MSSDWSYLPSEILKMIGKKISKCSVKHARLTFRAWTEPMTVGEAHIEGMVPSGVTPTFHNISSLYWKNPPSDKVEFDKVPIKHMKNVSIIYDLNLRSVDPLLDDKRKVLDNLFRTEMSSLESFSIMYGANIVPTGISNWPSASRITTLTLGYCNLEDSVITEISKLANLTSLDLSGNRITNNGIERMSRMNRLSTLILASCLVNDNCLLHLPKTITSLDVSLCRYMKFEPEFVSHMPPVTTLKLKNVGIDSSVLRSFPSSITSLDLSDIFHVPLELDGNLSHMTSLKTLILTGTRSITDKCLETLPPSITHLDLYWCTAVRLRLNLNLPMLKTIDISGNRDIMKHKCFRFFDFFTFTTFQIGMPSLTHIYYDGVDHAKFRSISELCGVKIVNSRYNYND